MIKHDVFVSYSSRDGAFVRALVADLKKAGLQVWHDEARLVGGDPLLEKVNDAIGQAGAVLVVLSEDSIRSRWVLKEIELASSREISTPSFRIIPVLLGPVETPSLLSGKVQISFDPDYLAGLEKLLQALGQVVNKEEPEEYSLAFLQRIKAALEILRRESWCYVAPSIPEKILRAVRESCGIPGKEEILAVVTKFGWIYTGFLTSGPFGSKGKEALVFTQRGVYGAGFTQARLFWFVHEVQLRKSFREFREVKVFPYESEMQRQGGPPSTSYCIALENFRMSFPAATRNQLVNVLNLIQTL
jgi:hypothetical protein